MKYFALVMISILSFCLASAQSSKLPQSEIQTLMFITEAYGTSATILNPAGLARKSYDDGLYANFNFLNNQKTGEASFAFSMGNLGFGYQKFILDNVEFDPSFTYYRLGLAIGGKILAFGTSNKIIALDMKGFSERVFSVDAGFIFEPVHWITLAGFGRDLDEPTIGKFHFKREYTAGVSLNLPEKYVRFLIEGTWDDSIIHIEDADFKIAIAFSPVQNMDFIVGGIRNLVYDDNYFALARFPIWGGVQLALAARFDQNWSLNRYFTSLHFPLQTVTF